MKITRVNTKRVELSKEELATLNQAKDILDKFVEEVSSNYGDDALEYLGLFLAEDVPYGFCQEDYED